MIRCLTFLCLLTTTDAFILDTTTGPATISPESCTDTGDVNCETADVFLDVCGDIAHAKSVCRKYCQLCDLVDGNWTDWSTWSTCDVQCGTGNMKRTRTCTNPAPANLGLNCTGPDSEPKTCSLDPCPVHGGWTVWSLWGSCSVSCGVGIQRRDRTCTNPTPKNFGDHCFGDNNEDQLCFPGNCTVHAGWGTWGTWGTCSASCGVGMQHRERTCSNPAPQYFGDHCVGDGQQYQLCHSSHCSVHGGWSPWASWGTCSVTCGAGIQRRYRACTNPPPQYIGDQCSGDNHDNKLCFPGRCADGGWSGWSSWGSCSKTCAERGIRTRDRYCNNPTPSMLGKYCQGPSTQSDICGYAPVYVVKDDGTNCCVEYYAGSHVDGNSIIRDKVRLCSGNAGGTCHPKQGRLEVLYNGWGSVCDDVWDRNNNGANVLCRSIGYCSGTNIARIAGPSSSQIHLDDVRCNGNETSIFSCQHRAWNAENCAHSEDVTILCE